MIQQNALWHDTLEDALRDIVTALGGPKKTASMIWPDKDLTSAARLLNHCLDPDRAEKLELSQLVFLIRKGREAGCHTAMAYLASESGYETPRPIDPETEQEKLMREYIQATERLEKIAARMERRRVMP